MSEFWHELTLDNGADHEEDFTPSCSIRIAGLMDRDYVFLLSPIELDQNRAIKDIIPLLADDLLLEQSALEVVTVYPDQTGTNEFNRYNLRWSEKGPQLVEPNDAAAVTVGFLQTLLDRSIAFDD